MSDGSVSQGDVLRAIQELRTEVRSDVAAIKNELSASFQSGLAAVNLAIATLTESHHRQVIEQERRNAEFAHRTRLDELIEQVHGHSNKISAHEIQIQTNIKRLAETQLCTEDLEKRIDATDHHIDANQLGLLHGTLGYVIASLLTVAGAAAGFAFNHFIK